MKPEPTHRGARRRLRTRAKLIEAGFRVMAEKGVEGATINEITEAADVGFGSFYNHFPSKEALFEAVVAEKVERFGRALDSLPARQSDSAEILAGAIRHTLRQVGSQPEWGWFIYRIGPWMLRRKAGLVGRMAQRIRKGIDNGRFQVSDPEMAVVAAVGGILATIDALLHGEVGEDAPERMARQCLLLLGLGAAEAGEICRRPLPALPVPPEEAD